MEKLYNNLAQVYHIMYQSFINYDEEFNYYSTLFKKYNINSVIELACGTGNLGKRFIEHNYSYLGIDVSENMLAIAEQQSPQGHFTTGDMRHFSTSQQYDGALIAGRSTSYLLSNKDVTDTLQSIKRHLNKGGIVVFDVINALQFLPTINKNTITHTVHSNGITYTRESLFTINASQGWTWDWQADYFLQKENEPIQKVSSEVSTLRTFTQDEITLFLTLNGFTLLACQQKASYAFDTLVFVAQIA